MALPFELWGIVYGRLDDACDRMSLAHVCRDMHTNPDIVSQIRHVEIREHQTREENIEHGFPRNACPRILSIHVSTTTHASFRAIESLLSHRRLRDVSTVRIVNEFKSLRKILPVLAASHPALSSLFIEVNQWQFFQDIYTGEWTLCLPLFAHLVDLEVSYKRWFDVSTQSHCMDRASTIALPSLRRVCTTHSSMLFMFASPMVQHFVCGLDTSELTREYMEELLRRFPKLQSGDVCRLTLITIADDYPNRFFTIEHDELTRLTQSATNVMNRLTDERLFHWEGKPLRFAQDFYLDGCNYHCRNYDYLDADEIICITALASVLRHLVNSNYKTGLAHAAKRVRRLTLSNMWVGVDLARAIAACFSGTETLNMRLNEGSPLLFLCRCNVRPEDLVAVIQVFYEALPYLRNLFIEPGEKFRQNHFTPLRAMVDALLETCGKRSGQRGRRLTIHFEKLKLTADAASEMEAHYRKKTRAPEDARLDLRFSS